MAGVHQGLRVLDLSSGIAGPMTTMLLADNGAEVIKIEPPGGDPCRTQPTTRLGYHVWQRGKQSAVLDLGKADDHAAFLALVRSADVLVTSAAPGEGEKLGIDYPALSALNPRLVYCGITGYGEGTADAKRPAIDALVQARTGLMFEQRGWPEGALNHLAGREDAFAEVEIPDDWLQGAPRPGPLFPASAWPSLGAFFTASVGIAAALRVRGVTGKGQKVEASLVQGAMAGAAGVWIRAENIDAPGFDSWILGSRAPKGQYQCKDGQWIHNWVPNPRFILQASAGDTLNATPNLTVQNDPDRFGTGPEELLVMTHYQPILAEAIAKFDADEWVQAAEVAEMTMQKIRSVEESLADPLFLKDGCVVETEDAELGRIRTVGAAYKMSETNGVVNSRVAAVGEHTESVKAEAARILAAAAPSPGPAGHPLPLAGEGKYTGLPLAGEGKHTGLPLAGEEAAPAYLASPAAFPSPASGRGWPAGPGEGMAKPRAPLEGIVVLDLGLAIAGPFGAQLLGDLGATVIKINGLYDLFWHRVHIAYMANRGKQSITLNLKDPRAMAIFLKLVEGADVIHHNMRYDAAERLKIDYESLKAIKPDLIYCHTRGFETGHRAGLPGNDQTGACLSGIQFEDGGMARGGKPLWSLTSFGDTGNGFLSAVAVINAIAHRDATGKGQMVDTSIINAALLNTSYAVATPDGKGFARPHIDADQTGYHAGHRIYPTADGWLCWVLGSDAHWQAALTSLGLQSLANDVRFATEAARAQHDAALAEAVAAALKQKPAADWFAVLDAAGLPVEVVNTEFSRQLHDNPEFIARQWVTSYPHPHVGKLDQIGLLFGLSDTPGVIQGRPVIVGEHTKEILTRLGYSAEDITTMEEQMAIGFAGMPRMPNRKPNAPPPMTPSAAKE